MEGLLKWLSFLLVFVLAMLGAWTLWQNDFPKTETYQIRVFSDPETGCEYLVLENRGIVPRIDNKGGVICRESKTGSRQLNSF